MRHNMKDLSGCTTISIDCHFLYVEKIGLTCNYLIWEFILRTSQVAETLQECTSQSQKHFPHSVPMRTEIQYELEKRSYGQNYNRQKSIPLHNEAWHKDDHYITFSVVSPIWYANSSSPYIPYRKQNTSKVHRKFGMKQNLHERKLYE
jgi:hypothetical protein